MRQMKDSGIEWVGQIPQVWDVVPIRAVFCENLRINYDGHIQNALQFKFGKIVPKTNFDPTEEYVANAILKYSVVQKDMFVINGLNLNFDFVTKRVGIVETEGVITSAYMSFAITDIKRVSPRYSWYVFRNYDDRGAFHNMGGGVRKILTFNELKHNHFIVPPLAEQERIAEFLDTKCAEVDALAGEIKEQIATLEEYKRSVITEAVTKGLDASVPMKDSGIEWIGEIPQAWDVRKGKYLFAQRNERGNNVKLQLLSPTQNYGVIPQDEYERLSGMSAVKLNENINLKALKTIHKGDYCISLRSFQGGFEYSMNEGVISPAYQVFYPTVKISGGYYRYLFKDKGFISVINSYAMSLRDGKNISFEQFGNTVIPVPPFAEQEKIAEFLDAKCAKEDALIAEKQNQLATLEEYKKSVIFEYVTGKKEVV